MNVAKIKSESNDSIGSDFDEYGLLNYPNKQPSGGVFEKLRIKEEKNVKD